MLHLGFCQRFFVAFQDITDSKEVTRRHLESILGFYELTLWLSSDLAGFEAMPPKIKRDLFNMFFVGLIWVIYEILIDKLIITFGFFFFELAVWTEHFGVNLARWWGWWWRLLSRCFNLLFVLLFLRSIVPEFLAHVIQCISRWQVLDTWFLCI